MNDRLIGRAAVLGVVGAGVAGCREQRGYDSDAWIGDAPDLPAFSEPVPGEPHA